MHGDFYWEPDIACDNVELIWSFPLCYLSLERIDFCLWGISCQGMITTSEYFSPSRDWKAWQPHFPQCVFSWVSFILRSNTLQLHLKAWDVYRTAIAGRYCSPLCSPSALSVGLKMSPAFQLLLFILTITGRTKTAPVQGVAPMPSFTAGAWPCRSPPHWYSSYIFKSILKN